MPSSQPLLPRQVTDLDLRLLRIFKVVVECGGFAAAEGVLDISRSTISVHMAKLESRLKARLATRGRRGFALTEHGRKVYEATLQLFQSLNEFALTVQNLEGGLNGEIVILCSDQVALTRQLHLPEVIAELSLRAPGLMPAINADTIPAIEQALLSGQADVGIMPDYRQIEGLSYRQAYSETFYLCVGARHPLFPVADHRIDERDIRNAATIHPGVDVNRSGIEQFQQLRLAARAYHFDTRTPLILSGCYLGFFPLSYIQGFLDRGEVRLLQPEKRYYNVDHVLVTRTDASSNKKVAVFLEAMAAVSAR